MAAKSCEKSSSVFATFRQELLPLKLLLLAHYGARKVLFTGLAERGGVIVNCLLSNGKKQAHPSYHTAKPARATHRVSRNELVVPHPVL